VRGKPRMRSAVGAALVACALCAGSAGAVTVIAGDVNEDPSLPAAARMSWETEAFAQDADELLVEDFELEPIRRLQDGDNQVGLVNVFLNDADLGSENQVTQPTAPNGSRGLVGAVRNPNGIGVLPDPDYIRIDFPEPIVAFGADYSQTIGFARLTVTAEGEEILFGDYLNQPPQEPGDPGSGSGFLGLVFDAPVTQVTFGVEGAGTHRNQLFALDDLSFVTAVAPPFTVIAGDANEDPALPAEARTDWEIAALAQDPWGILDEDFEAVPSFFLGAGDNEVGLVSIFLDRNGSEGETQVVEPTDPNGSKGFVGVIANPNAGGGVGTDPKFIRIDFPQPVLAFAADFTRTIDTARLTLTALGAEVRFGDHLSEPPAAAGVDPPIGSGFLGLVFDEPVLEVVFAVEGAGTDPSQLFHMDDLSIATVPEPGAALARLAALAALSGFATRRRAARDRR